MAKRKTAPIITLTREVLPSGNIYLTSPKKILDKRNDRKYSEVECEPRHEIFFKEAE